MSRFTSHLSAGLSHLVEEVEARRMFAAVTVAGTAGDDTINVTVNASAVIVTLNGVATSYTAVRSLNVSGGGGNDNITVDQSVTLGCAISGNAGNDWIAGGAGNDSITGNSGNDTIQGWVGDDQIIGGDGADNIDGGDGSDTIYSFDATSNTDGDLDYIFQFWDNSGTDTIHSSLTEDQVRHSIL